MIRYSTFWLMVLELVKITKVYSFFRVRVIDLFINNPGSTTHLQFDLGVSVCLFSCDSSSLSLMYYYVRV